MSTTLDRLVAYLQQTLQPEHYPDYCPNGLQAVGEHLAGRFALEHRFIDIDNPV